MSVIFVVGVVWLGLVGFSEIEYHSKRVARCAFASLMGNFNTPAVLIDWLISDKHIYTTHCSIHVQIKCLLFDHHKIPFIDHRSFRVIL